MAIIYKSTTRQARDSALPYAVSVFDEVKIVDKVTKYIDGTGKISREACEYLIDASNFHKPITDDEINLFEEENNNDNDNDSQESEDEDGLVPGGVPSGTIIH